MMVVVLELERWNWRREDTTEALREHCGSMEL